MSKLTLSLLGPPEIKLGGELVQIGRRKAVALLAYLAMTKQLHTRDALAALFWPTQDQLSALGSLRVTLLSLKKALGKEWLEVTPGSLGLEQSTDLWLDVEHFRSQADGCQAHSRAVNPACLDCLARLSAAVALYRGDFLAGFTLRDSEAFDDWQQVESARLRRELSQSLELLAQGRRQRGEYELAIVYARRWLEFDPLHEPAYHLLMDLYRQTGQWAAAVRQYKECVRVLKHELGMPPQAETQQLYQIILRDSEIEPFGSPPTTSQTISDLPAEPRPPTTARHNLPAPLTSLIGREHEIAQIKQWLTPDSNDETTIDQATRTRLLTLLGLGGIGKTRLAISVAGELVGAFPGGVWWVELAAISNPALIPQAVAVALGVHEYPHRPLMSLLIDYMSNEAALLLLDNCEHLVQACAQFAEAMLRACPRLRILATSREALGVAGEIAFSVSPLPLPELTPLPAIESLAKCEAVRLFLERATAVQPSFGLTAQNAWAIAQICAQVDGIPLAIELAAARVCAMSTEQIAARLDDRFHLLIGGSRTGLPRQQALQASMDWSYDLLAENERILLRRLSVFVGGWTLEAAEEVCGDREQSVFALGSAEVLDALTQLVKKSLLVFEEKNGQARYRLLETIRQYGHDRLLEAGEDKWMRDRHLEFFLRWAEQVEPHLWGEQQKMWLDRMEQEHDNLRAALAWSLAQENTTSTEAGLRMGVAMGAFWLVRGHLVEGNKWLAGLLNQTALLGSTSARANALNLAGDLAHKQGDDNMARSFYAKGLAAGRELGDERAMAYALLGLGYVIEEQEQNRAKEIPLFEESLALFRRLDDRPGLASALAALASAAACYEQYERADSLWQESLMVCQTMGHQIGIVRALDGIGRMALLRGQYAQASLALEESAATYRTFDDKMGLLLTLNSLGEAARYAGGYASAVAYYEESLQLSKLVGARRYIATTLHNLGHALCRLGDHEKARALFTEGLLLSQELDNQVIVMLCLMGLAGTMEMQGQIRAAVQLLGAVESLLTALGAIMAPVDRAEQDRYLDSARSQLDPATFADAWGKGQTMTLEQAISYALKVTGPCQTISE